MSSLGVLGFNNAFYNGCYNKLLELSSKLCTYIDIECKDVNPIFFQAMCTYPVRALYAK